MSGPSEERNTEAALRVVDFDFDLPAELIAQQPPAERGLSRMLAVDRATGALRDASFAEFSSLLNPGDLLVLNESRVIPARLYARRTKNSPPVILSDTERCEGESKDLRLHLEAKLSGGPDLASETWETHQPTGKIEVFLTEPGAPSFPRSSAERVGNLEPRPASGENLWRALVRPGRKVAIGEILLFPAPDGEIALRAEVIGRGDFGERLLRFDPVDDFFAVLDRIGHIPLPPYIRRDDAAADRERYQTVFSRERGSVAAPTAGLHFTPQILDALTARGVEVARITLHVGLGTFAPLRVDRLDQVRLHRERYTLTPSAADAINNAAQSARRIVAVGTTVVRTLEHCAMQANGRPLEAHSGETEIFISPGFEFRLVGALLTNFHLPQSSLLMLVSAFAGREQVLAAYAHAVQEKYRFFSYGDCMFLG